MKKELDQDGIMIEQLKIPPSAPIIEIDIRDTEISGRVEWLKKVEKAPVIEETLTESQKGFLLAEMILGRLAMTSFVFGILNEFLSGRSLLQQLGVCSAEDQVKILTAAGVSLMSTAFIFGVYCFNENQEKDKKQQSRIGRIYRKNEWPKLPWLPFINNP